MIKFHGAACALARLKHRCFWGKKAAPRSSGARSANKLWLWVRSAADSTNWMNSWLSHYWQFPLLGKFLFPVTSALSALEELSYQIQILARLTFPLWKWVVGFQDTGGHMNPMAPVLWTSSRNTELKVVSVTTEEDTTFMLPHKETGHKKGQICTKINIKNQKSKSERESE